VGFGLLALGLSLVLSVVAWVLVSQALVREARAAALTETTLDANQLGDALGSRGTAPAKALDDMPRTQADAAIVFVGQRWFASSPALGPTVLPQPLESAVATGRTATQRVSVDGRLFLAVGMPMRSVKGSFFEMYALSSTVSATRTLSLGLGAATALTVLLGVVVGRSATRVALRPLVRLNTAAAEVASGRFDVRLDDGGDPDLVSITESFNQTVSDLDRRVVADARFAVDVSHELRTPLMTMLNSMQVIRNREDTLPQPLREPVELLADDLDRFRLLVTDLLEVSRHDAGDQLVLDSVVVGDLVRHAADGAAGRPVTRVADDARNLTMVADKRRLERVIVNLVRNAQVHGDGCIDVTVTRHSDVVRITVDDQGPGIPPELRERVFERFARGSTTSSVGVGLGLAIVQRHVELHGGSVAATDGPNGGARLVVTIPLERR
jgi:signal transduction histidine kinase